MRVGYGEGLIIAVLLSVVLYLLGLANAYLTISIVFLLVGLWTMLFGLVLAKKDQRLYYSGWGIVVALISTFYFLPLAYTTALVLIGVIAIVVISISTRRPQPQTTRPAAD